MSSTNRGYERHKTDYYLTPKWCIKDFLEAWIKDEELSDDGMNFQDSVFLDPCAGGDKDNGMPYPKVVEEFFPLAEMKTIDIRKDSKAEISADYLHHVLGYEPDVIITNPPFYLAKEIIEKALKDVHGGGYVVMLLRLNFFGSKARKKFLQDTMPVAAYVHNRRMSFTADGKTDSIEYMHAVWKKGEKVEFTKLKII